MLQATLEHYRTQQRLTAAGVLDAQRALRRGVSSAAETVAAWQVLVARDAVGAVGGILDEQGIEADLEVTPRPESVAGTASDGRSLTGLLDQAQTDRQFSLIVATQLQDVARSAFSLGMTARPAVEGYVRVLNPPSCSRCAALAGKFFRWNDGFQRHPKCDCRHEPTTQGAWRDLIGSHDTTSNPDAYFRSLSVAEQDRIFTQAGAQAIRDGADLNQVVNARRGMQRAQVFGQNIWKTLEGTTRRGYAYSQIGTNRALDRRIQGERYFRTQQVRVMPETIYALAKDRADAIRLLKLNGFVI